MEKISIIIPTRNDYKSVNIQLKMCKTFVETPHEIIINTEEGVINAVKEGVKKAKGEYIVLLPSDDLGVVFSIDDMYKEIKEGYDLINVTRYAKGGKYIGGSISSKIFSRIANKILSIFGSLTDYTMGVKMFRKDVFEKMIFKSKPIGWAFALEMVMKAEKEKLRIKEMPIISINRIYGKSSFKLGWLWEYLKVLYANLEKK